MRNDSHRQILRSTSIIGSAAIINILIGLVRVKVAAVLLGPAGVGLIGLFSSLMATAANVFALGMGTVGTRQIAEANSKENAYAIVVARRALFLGTLVMAVVGVLVFWLLRGLFATHVLANSALSNEVGWLALGVGLTVLCGSQGALLNGLRRIGDLARISIYSAMLATTLGVGALLLWHERGLLVYLLVTPVASFIVGRWYVARLPKAYAPPTHLRELTQQWGMLARLGVTFMLAGLAVTAGQLVVRALVQRELGAEALGAFEASWVISMTYIGFVLRAMGTDYYPRLTAVIHDHAAVNKLVNEQTEVALLLAGPIFLAMLGMAPWVIELLYSSKFSEAATVLRWQILGDILKVASWPLGFVILAAGNGRHFMLCEIFVTLIFIFSVWQGLPFLGLPATGVGFLLMYAALLPIVYWLAKKRTGFCWTPAIKKLIIFLSAACVLISVFSNVHPLAAATCGVAFSMLFAWYSISRLKVSIPVLNEKWQKFRRLLGLGPS